MKGKERYVVSADGKSLTDTHTDRGYVLAKIESIPSKGKGSRPKVAFVFGNGDALEVSRSNVAGLTDAMVQAVVVATTPDIPAAASPKGERTITMEITREYATTMLKHLRAFEDHLVEKLVAETVSR